MAKVGIKVKVKAYPKQKFFPKIAKQRTSFFMLGWDSSDGDGSSFLDSIVHTRDNKRGYGLYNYSGYSNKRVDELIEKSDLNMDLKTRIEQMHEAQRIALLDEQNIIPLHYQADMYASKKWINFTPRVDSKIWIFDIK